MMPVDHELARAVWAQAWQITALIVVVGLLTRYFARNRPHLAHALWLVVLLKCVTPPVFSSTSGVFCWIQSEPTGQSTEQPVEAVRPAAPPVEQQSIPLLPDATAASTSEVESSFPTEPVPSGNAIASSSVELDELANPVPRAIESKLPARSRSEWTMATLLSGWALGTLVVLGVAAVRWAGCLRQIHRSGFVANRSYDRLMATLSRRLKLWRPARLVITPSRVGPAVIGLLRPTVLLPEIIVRGKSAEELQPILAHELIHVRRGDIWVGMLQMLGQALWWFHPLVWWAGRLASREAERCCDESVVAELGCSPARYARCLLDVLELKQDIKPVPTFPGVRPVEVTSRRMERIMRLGQGSRKRSPWWCWLVMVLAAAATLPGAALVVGADDETPDHPCLKKAGEGTPATAGPLALPDIPYDPANASASPAAATPADSTQQEIVRVYEVGDLLATVASERELDQKGAKEFVLHKLPFACGETGSTAPKRHLVWSGKKLVVRDTVRGHELFADGLEHVRKYGLDLIDVQVCFMSGPAKLIETLDIDWPLVPTEIPTAETPQKTTAAELAALKGPWPGGDPEAHQNRAEVVVKKNVPSPFAVLDEKQTKAVLERFNDDRRVPKVRLFNGRVAYGRDGSQSPFVVGIKDGKPQIRVVSEGAFVQFSPLLQENNCIRLDCRLTMSKIRGVETETVSLDRGQTSATVQVPEVETTCIECSILLDAGDALLLRVKSMDPDKPTMLVMLRAEKVSPKGTAVRDRDPLVVRTYNVADLVMPPHLKAVHAADSVEAKEKPKESIADFDALIELITTAIQPETWDDYMGGHGSIAPFETNLSLVVSQTQEVHEEIAALLEQVRRMHDLQVIVATEIVSMPQEMVRRIGIDFDPKENHTTLTPREARMFRALVEESKTGSTRLMPKMTFFNGQRGDVLLRAKAKGLPGGVGLWVQPVVPEDRRSVRLDLFFYPKGAHATSARRIAPAVGDGQTLLWDVTEWLPPTSRAVGVPISPGSRRFRQLPAEASTDKTFLLVTPKILVSEEKDVRPDRSKGVPISPPALRRRVGCVWTHRLEIRCSVAVHGASRRTLHLLEPATRYQKHPATVCMISA